MTVGIRAALVRLLHLTRSEILCIAILLTGSELSGAVVAVAEVAFDGGSKVGC